MVYETMNALYPVASETNSESCGSTTKATQSLEENCRISAKKRKASSKPESPNKKLRSASGPAQLAVEAVSAKSRKRKGSTQRETPVKKQKSVPNEAVSSEPIKGTSWKGQDKSNQLPATETPGLGNRKSDCEPSLGCSSPSTSTYHSGSTSLPFKSIRARFEDKYLELDMLGEGGFGSVYAGRRKTDNLPKEVILVMERPDPCVDLLTYVENNGGPLKEDVAKNIMKQLVDAALNMHAKGVFHRDIKAENVLIETSSSDPRVRIIDFGCGCIVQEEPYSYFSGTSAFAPPEFFTHGRYEAAPTTVWQLGALLYEMLDGEQEFTTSMFLRKRIHFNSEMSQDCKNFLRMCLTRSPKERATLEQIQLNPWLQNPAQFPPETLSETQ